MADDFIRYDMLIQEAMRGLVRTVLKDASVRGLSGDHHFFISFDTNHPGVTLSTRMRAQYPQEMTIVLQHQFWDLKVTDDNFEVGLSFNGVTERLVIPFAAIRRFADPSVNFDIRFAEITDRCHGRSGQGRERCAGKGRRTMPKTRSPLPKRPSPPSPICRRPKCQGRSRFA